jgi:hypothetical protein
MSRLPDFTQAAFPRGEDNYATIFMLWLTPKEWQLCFTLSFAWQENGELNPDLPLSEGYRAVIDRLQREYSYSWAGVVSDENRDLWARQREPISRDNMNWILLMHPEVGYGKVPDYGTHFPASIDYCQANLELVELAPLLRTCWDRLHQRLQDELATPLPEERKEELREQMRKDQKLAEITRDFMQKQRETDH